MRVIFKFSLKIPSLWCVLKSPTGTLHQLKLLPERCHGFGGPPLTSGCESTHGSPDFTAAAGPSGTLAASLRRARLSGWTHAFWK